MGKTAKGGSAFKALPASLKPREQMEALGTARGMSPEALLAILLKTGTSGCDVGVAAKRFLAAFQGVGEMIRCDWKGLMSKIADYNKSNPQNPVRGIGKVKCMELAAAFELVRIAYEKPQEGELPQIIETSADAAKWFRAKMRLGDDREHFFVLPLDAAGDLRVERTPERHSGRCEGSFCAGRPVAGCGDSRRPQPPERRSDA